MHFFGEKFYIVLFSIDKSVSQRLDFVHHSFFGVSLFDTFLYAIFYLVFFFKSAYFSLMFILTHFLKKIQYNWHITLY